MRPLLGHPRAGAVAPPALVNEMDVNVLTSGPFRAKEASDETAGERQQRSAGWPALHMLFKLSQKGGRTSHIFSASLSSNSPDTLEAFVRQIKHFTWGGGEDAISSRSNQNRESGASQQADFGSDLQEPCLGGRVHN